MTNDTDAIIQSAEETAETRKKKEYSKFKTDFATSIKAFTNAVEVGPDGYRHIPMRCKIVHQSNANPRTPGPDTWDEAHLKEAKKVFPKLDENDSRTWDKPSAAFGFMTDCRRFSKNPKIEFSPDFFQQLCEAKFMFHPGCRGYVQPTSLQVLRSMYSFRPKKPAKRKRKYTFDDS